MHFLNTWNIFSRSLLIKNELNNSLIITKDENIKKYKKIFDSLHNPLIDINNLSELIDSVYNSSGNFIVSYDIFFASIPNIWELENKYILKIEKDAIIDIDEIIKQLHDFWYKFRDFLEWWDYKKSWDTLCIRFKNKPETYIISFWGESVENIYRENGIHSGYINQLFIWKNQTINYFLLNEKWNIELVELFQKKHLILDNIDILEGYNFLENHKNVFALEILKNPNREQINLERNDLFIENIESLLKILKSEKKITLYTKNSKTISHFLEYNGIENASIHSTSLTLLKSFSSPQEIIICDDNLSKIFVKKRLKRSLSENIDLLLQIKPWDFVVHIDHGIWIFHAIVEKEIGNLKKEYLEIDYKNNDKLFVPITEVRRISKYIWNENPQLTGLSTKEWSKKLQKVQEDVQKVAEELLEIYAHRKITPWFAFEYFQNEIVQFQRSFDYEYTLDQVNAIDEILQDMSSPIPMERILVWDVWFGKTEIAFNTIYNAFLNGKQSIIISPLVVLTYEHYNKACERFSKVPIHIEVLTRFESLAQANRVKEQLKSWKIDLIIWTHRLLSESIEYKNLGLLVIDEEHKFWVKDKEKIKEMKGWIDILSMSATPIPRSLNMALNGIKDVSILSKPPLMRKWVETFVSQFDDHIIKQAWTKEFERGGQLFFIHNRVDTIESMWKYLSEIFPWKKIIITHGQLHGHDLEDRILAFKRREYDILLSSTVIENGIDFSNVNTIIINEAYKFGISQIHQLRWRVWRWDQNGYCYLLFKRDTLSEDAAKRLTTMVEYSHLWAWFELAIRDLEIRWWGDILGIKQSWLSSEVWVSVYLQLLEDKIEELKSSQDVEYRENSQAKRLETTIDLNISAYLWDDFFASELDKLNFYREIESIRERDELENLITDFQEFCGELREEHKNLFQLLEVKIMASVYKIKSIKRSWVSYEIVFHSSLSIEELKSFLVLDTQVKFIVSGLTKLTCSCQKFRSDLEFLQYLYKIMRKKGK